MREWWILQFIFPTATVSVVHTDLWETDLEELCNIDEESSQEGREEIAEDTTGAGLDLSVVVRPTDGQVSLNTNCYDEEDAQTQHDPVGQLEQNVIESKLTMTSLSSLCCSF